MAPIIVLTMQNGDRHICDAGCYDNDSPDCGCVCGGRNHGIGLDAALAKNREYYKKMPDPPLPPPPHVDHLVILTDYADPAIHSRHFPVYRPIPYRTLDLPCNAHRRPPPILPWLPTDR